MDEEQEKAPDPLRALSLRVAALEEEVRRLSASPEGGGRQKDLETAIDQMVAGALLRGQRTQGALNGMFNIAPGLAGR